jgi:hypothetical protein
MKGTPIIKLKSLSMGRKVLLGGAAAATLGLAMLGGTAAHAAAPVGNDPGQITISSGTGGSTTATGLTYTTLKACPAGSQGSGALTAVNSDGINTTLFSPVTNGTASPWTGQLNTSFHGMQALTGTPNGGEDELVIDCNSQASLLGNDVFTMDIWVDYSADGTTYTLHNSPQVTGPAATTTVVTATPNPAQVGSTVTLNATVTANSGSNTPAGTVQFQVGGTNIGSAVTLSAAGTASTTTTFTATGAQSVTAVFTPSDTTKFGSSTSAAFSENITTTNPLAIGEIITVSVAPTGTFTFATSNNQSNPTVTLAEATNGASATGSLVPVVVTDTRTGLAANPAVPSLVNGFNGFPGWSVVGQATDFTAPNSHPAGTIAVANLQWAPSTPSQGDFVLGTASTTGLGTAQTLASAASGHGNGASTLSANLTLTIPSTAPAGAYTSTLTLTANPTANFS